MENKFMPPKPCVLLDLNGNIIKECNSLQELSRHLNKGQINKKQYNNGSILNSKFRIFTKDYYLNNKDYILGLKKISCNRKYKKQIADLKRIVLCDLFPFDEFTVKTIALKLKMTPQNVRNILKGRSIVNYGIKWKHPELNK